MHSALSPSTTIKPESNQDVSSETGSHNRKISVTSLSSSFNFESALKRSHSFEYLELQKTCDDAHLNNYYEEIRHENSVACKRINQMVNSQALSTCLRHLKRHTVTAFCLLFLIQLLYFFLFSTIHQNGLLKDYLFVSVLTFSLIAVIPLCGVVGSVGGCRRPTIVFLFLLGFVALPYFGLQILSVLGMGAILYSDKTFWKELFSEVGLHTLFDFVGGILALVAGVLFLDDLERQWQPSSKGSNKKQVNFCTV